MSLFNNPFKGIVGSIIEDQTQRIPKEIRQHTRKTTEDIADKINPVLGNMVRSVNNLHDTIENATESLDPTKVISNQLFNSVSEKDLERGDHLFTQGAGYTHHGLYLGNNEVIHYAHDSSKSYISVRTDSLTTFADDKSIMKKSDYESPANYSISEIISRAYSRLGERSYNLAANNCENFVRWCRHGGEEYENR